MKPAREAIEEALREERDSDERWKHFRLLHDRNDDDAFSAAAGLLD